MKSGLFFLPSTRLFESFSQRWESLYGCELRSDHFFYLKKRKWQLFYFIFFPPACKRLQKSAWDSRNGRLYILIQFIYIRHRVARTAAKTKYELQRNICKRLQNYKPFALVANYIFGGFYTNKECIAGACPNTYIECTEVWTYRMHRGVHIRNRIKELYIEVKNNGTSRTN